MSGPACAYCRTGSAGPYLANHRADRRIAGKVSAHDPACPDYGPPESGTDFLVLYCQECDLERVLPRWAFIYEGAHLGPDRRATGEGPRLACPACERKTLHHSATRDVVEAEECTCWACRIRRNFEGGR